MARVVTGVYDVQGQVLDVQAVTTRSGKAKYEIAFSDGNKYSTFARPVAEQAAAVKGAPNTTLRIEQSQNGQYTNLDLAEVNPVGQALAPAPSAIGSAIGGITPAPVIASAPPRDFAAETRGKVRHGAIIAGLEAATRTSQGESDPELFERATKFAQAIEQYVLNEQPAQPAQVEPVVNAPAPTVEAIVQTGLVQVGTAGIVTPEAQVSGGLPWGQQAS